ncbi:histone H1 [Aspergillus niger]|uniref:Histone H1 n=1 Tax=Aspergillus niger TaxID=5061 RepID=A0A100IP33_ASPNG|nr:histone H1 [Aspergillus niger]
MPPKKTSTTGTTTTKKSGSSHASYRDMIKDAILNLKERNGSSRQSIKKYVQANNKIASASTNAFDSQFNKAIKAGVEKGEFLQPKGKFIHRAHFYSHVATVFDTLDTEGRVLTVVVRVFHFSVLIFDGACQLTRRQPGPSGPVKLAKKEAAPKPAAKKTATKAATAKKPAAKKTEKTEKAEKPKTTKKATTTTAKKPVGRPKANTAKPRKASTTAPAVVDKPKVLKTTKSGRVTKTTAKPAEKATKKTTKKAAKETAA